MLVGAVGREDAAQIFKEEDVLNCLPFTFDLWSDFLRIFQLLGVSCCLGLPVLKILRALLASRVVEVAMPHMVLYSPLIFAGLIA